MDKQQLQNSLESLKKTASKRNFKQSVDLVLNLKDINLKNPDEAVNMFVTLHNQPGKNVSVCALVGPELEEKAKAACDEVVLLSDFDKFKSKKDMKKLADRHDFFIAQANLMAKIATVFGRVFGPRGKMPNPKVGAVVPPNANLDQLVEKLKKTLHLQTKNDPTVRCMVGKEDTPDEQVIDNIQLVYSSILAKLPNDHNNVKSVMIKYTMGQPVVVVGGSKTSSEPEDKQEAKEEKEAQEASSEQVSEHSPESQSPEAVEEKAE